MSRIIQEFRQRILEAGSSRQPLRIRGGGSKDWYGQALNGEILDTRAYSGIVADDPTELAITARAGTPLAEIEQALAQQNQMLAFEPPHFGPGATIGGVVAAGLSGPRRQAAGAVRDFVLGAVLMDGKGDILHFGGQVMKNVAGYDVSRLLAGSLGTLGLILEVSLKVLPRPLLETTLRFSMAREEAIRRLNEWGGQPLPLSASAWHGGVLLVRLSGAPAAIEAAIARMGGEQVENADGLWLSLREQSNDFFNTMAPETSLWRLSLPTYAAPLQLDGDELIEWGGAQRWLKTTAGADAIRTAAKEAGGHASLFRGGDKALGVFQPLPPAIARIHGGLKKAFDPAGIFNVGRLYPEF